MQRSSRRHPQQGGEDAVRSSPTAYSQPTGNDATRQPPPARDKLAEALATIFEAATEGYIADPQMRASILLRLRPYAQQLLIEAAQLDKPVFEIGDVTIFLDDGAVYRSDKRVLIPPALWDVIDIVLRSPHYQVSHDDYCRRGPRGNIVATASSSAIKDVIRRLMKVLPSFRLVPVANKTWALQEPPKRVRAASVIPPLYK